MRRVLTPDLLPDTLRTLREAAALTQTQVGQALGAVYLTIGRWETGANTPRADHLIALLNVYGYELVIQKRDAR